MAGHSCCGIRYRDAPFSKAPVVEDPRPRVRAAKAAARSSDEATGRQELVEFLVKAAIAGAVLAAVRQLLT